MRAAPPDRLLHSRVLLGACLVAVAPLASCASSQPAGPAPRPPPPPAPLTTAEIQRTVSGTARLHRQCRDLDAPSGLYIIRLSIDPSGRVTSASPRPAPPRTTDPAVYAGAPRYIGVGPEPRNAVCGCLAGALARVRFRRFSGPPVAFDYPVVVEKLPPSEAPSPARRCDDDGDCVFRPAQLACRCPPCPCRPCGVRWRRALSGEALAALREEHDRREERRCRRLHKRRKRRRMRRGRGRRRARPHRSARASCEPCREGVHWQGSQALCIDGQCSVR